MKAIIDLACQSYNLDCAFSQAGYEKKQKCRYSKSVGSTKDSSSPEEFMYHKISDP